MPKKEQTDTRPISEQIEELRAKIGLLEGDQKAYVESAELAEANGRKTITRLRKENKELRQELKDRLSADDHIINAAFQDKPKERVAFSNKTGKEAIRTLDDSVCDAKKKLNGLQFDSRKKQKRLDELKRKHGAMVKDQEDVEATESGKNEQGKHLRELENRLGKANLKANEADHIKKTYQQIKSKLQEEHLNFGNRLDNLESEIGKTRQEVDKLKEMHTDATVSRDQAQSELKRIEDKIYNERKAREANLQKLKREADEKLQQQEKIERRLAQRSALGLTNEDNDAENTSAEQKEEAQQKISTYEEAFKRIKEATGVSDLTEVVLRFENQGSTKEHLEQLKADSEKDIQRLKEERDAIEAELSEMKYTGESKLSSGQRILEQYQKELADETARRDDIQAQLDRCSAVLIKAKSGVEHLSDKVTHIKVAKGQASQAKVDQASDEYVLDLLGVCEEKLLKLLDHLQDHNTDDILRKIQQEEFYVTVENKMPQYNTRVVLPHSMKDTNYDDDEESVDDDGEVMTRAQLKRQSELLVDQKTKKRQPRKKKKGK